MRESFEWFLGANRLGVWMYDFATAGCRDGLGIHEASQNQGAESTVSFLTALFTMLDISASGAPGETGGAVESGEVLVEAKAESPSRSAKPIEVVR